MLFVQREERFFSPLRSQIDLLGDASSMFLEGVRGGAAELEACVRRIDDIRTRATQTDAELIVTLHHSLITPIDPEDILSFSSGIKKLIKSIYEAASRQQLCACQPAPPKLVEALEIVHQCSSLLKSAF